MRPFQKYCRAETHGAPQPWLPAYSVSCRLVSCTLFNTDWSAVIHNASACELHNVPALKSAWLLLPACPAVHTPPTSAFVLEFVVSVSYEFATVRFSM